LTYAYAIFILFLISATVKDWTFWFTKNPWVGGQMGNFELTN
jgi:hypothetical protein